MVIFLCRTPVHVMRAMQLHMYEDGFLEAGDICIADTFAGAERIACNLRETALFDEVFFLRQTDFSRMKRGAFAADFYLRDFEFKRLIKRRKYTKIACFNITSQESLLAYNMLKDVEGLQYYSIEDSPFIYDYSNEVPSDKAFRIYRLLGFRYPVFYTDRWYFSCPEKMKTLNQNPVYRLKPFDRDDKTFVTLANKVFSYVEDEKIRDADVMIMGESLNADRRLGNQDADIYRELIKRYPDKKFVLKPHPREKEDRFAQLCPVIKAKNIPWELYALNEDFSNKIFTSICCTTMISSKLLYDDEPRCILLYKILKDQIKLPSGELAFGKEMDEIIDFFPKLYHRRERFQVPETLDGYYSIWNQWLA